MDLISNKDDETARTIFVLRTALDRYKKELNSFPSSYKKYIILSNSYNNIKTKIEDLQKDIDELEIPYLRKKIINDLLN